MQQIVHLVTSMAPYLLLGFLLAGLMHAFIPARLYHKHLSQNNFRSTFWAAMIGIPLPLCSCGVIPTAMSMRREGASKGATLSFLIATPQTGVDSIIATYSLLGLPFAVLRPIAALCTALLGGTMANSLLSEDSVSNSENHPTEEKRVAGFWEKIAIALRYGFVEMMQDIGKWLILGLLVAGVITVVVPDSFFELFSHNSLLSMLIVLLFAIPMYLCATGSIPIAVALMLKGLSPGTALVLLMAGPAVNVASMLVIGKVLGRKTLLIYLLSIIFGAVGFGLAIDYLLPYEWFAPKLINTAVETCHHHSTLLDFNALSTIALAVLLANAMYQKLRAKQRGESCSCHADNHADHDKKQTLGAEKCSCQSDCHTAEQVSCEADTTTSISERVIHIEGMRCNHCAANVEKALAALPNVESAKVELANKRAIIIAEANKEIDEKAIRDAVESLGFKVLE